MGSLFSEQGESSKRWQGQRERKNAKKFKKSLGSPKNQIFIERVERALRTERVVRLQDKM